MNIREPREGDLVKQCLDYLRLARIFAWRNNTGATKVGKRFIRFGFPGSSDILGVLPPGGRLLVCEVKTVKGRTTESQEAFLSLVRTAGGVGLVVRSVDELRQGLRTAGIEAP